MYPWSYVLSAIVIYNLKVGRPFNFFVNGLGPAEEEEDEEKAKAFEMLGQDIFTNRFFSPFFQMWLKPFIYEM